MKYLSGILYSLIVVRAALAVEQSAPAHEFQLDKGLLNELYRQSLTEAKIETRSARTSVVITPQVSLLNPSEFVLRNNYFEVPYSQSLEGTPGFYLAAETLLSHFGGFDISAQGKIGYINREVVVPVTSASTMPLTDVVTLHWLPISIGTRLKYRISGLSQVIPTVAVSGGAQWIYQMGKLDGMSQGFWVSFYAVSPSLILFEPQTENQWFGGMSVGMTFFNSFGTNQIVLGSSFDVSAILVL